MQVEQQRFLTGKIGLISSLDRCILAVLQKDQAKQDPIGQHGYWIFKQVTSYNQQQPVLAQVNVSAVYKALIRLHQLGFISRLTHKPISQSGRKPYHPARGPFYHITEAGSQAYHRQTDMLKALLAWPSGENEDEEGK